MTLVIGSTASETHLDPHEDYRQAHPAVGRSDQDRKVSRQVASLAFCAEFGKVTVPAQPCPSGEFSKKVTPGAVGPGLLCPSPLSCGKMNHIQWVRLRPAVSSSMTWL